MKYARLGAVTPASLPGPSSSSPSLPKTGLRPPALKRKAVAILGAGPPTRDATADTEELDWLRADTPICEGVDKMIAQHSKSRESVEEDSDTSEGEVEAEGVHRARLGAGWRGIGPPLRTRRKNGGGLCSPGRWPIDKRRLPSGKLVDRLQNILVEGLRLCETGYPRAEPFAEGSTKQELLHLACGRRLRSPFPAAVLARTRDDMRLALLDHGFDSGL